MTPKKEIYLAVLNKLGLIDDIEHLGINRNQYAPDKESYPTHYIACLVKIKDIQWKTMAEQLQEGVATIEIMLYTRDGFAEQYLELENIDDGLAEADIIGDIEATLQFLHGTSFNAMQLTAEESSDTELDGITGSKLTYSCLVHQKTAERYIAVPNPLKAEAE